MKAARQTWTWAGSFSLAVLTTVGAVAQDPPADEPAVQAEKPADDPAAATDLQPVPDPAFGGVPPAANVVVPGMVVPAPSIGVAAPSVVGDYRVGHVHKAPLSRIFWYSAYNPYIDQLKAPIRARVFNNAHAPYYAGYRTIHTSNWTTYYVPQTQCYAPTAYGYTTTPPTADPNAVHGGQYANGPTAYAPYGAGSATYFGYYGPAGY
ncbi:MAG: hypothetical protein WBC44_15325 [Planctomycetaceae bacterium]